MAGIAQSWGFSAFLVVFAACKGPTDPFDPTQEPVVPQWIEAELQGQEDACSTSPYWDDPQAKVATSFFAGAYEWEGDDAYGSEFWFIWPDPELAATGFTPCTVVWDVIGTRGEPVRAGDFSFEVSAVLDEDNTDCVTDVNGVAIYAGDENFTETYDVSEVAGNVQMFYTGSGDLFGTGEANNGGFSWVSEKNCLLL